MTIETLRNEIDVIDAQLVDLLNRRYCCCVEIGKLKKGQGTMIRDASRERKIIDVLSEDEWHPGMIEAVWPAIMAFSRELQSDLGK
jgi:3-deoxy-7-phosphoheptulonate synthase/chorismate mutase